MANRETAPRNEEERIVKAINPDGSMVLGTKKETDEHAKRHRTIFRNVTCCHHCDEPFPPSYIRWHAARALRRSDRMAVLTCKKCCCWTPVQFSQQLEAEPA